MIRIPTRASAHFEQTTTLDGAQYVLKFDWVQRWGRWTLGIYTSNDAPLATGLTLQPGYNLAQYVSEIDGVMFVYDLANTGGAPAFDDLGPESSFRLYYISTETESDG